MERLGVSTSKVAELQHESGRGEVGEEELGTVRISLGIICGVAVSVTCLLTGLLYPAVRVCLGQGREEEEEEEEVMEVPGRLGLVTVYDKVDLLLPAQYSNSSLDTNTTLTGREERESIL